MIPPKATCLYEVLQQSVYSLLQVCISVKKCVLAVTDFYKNIWIPVCPRDWDSDIERLAFGFAVYTSFVPAAFKRLNKGSFTGGRRQWSKLYAGWHQSIYFLFIFYLCASIL